VARLLAKIMTLDLREGKVRLSNLKLRRKKQARLRLWKRAEVK